MSEQVSPVPAENAPEVSAEKDATNDTMSSDSRVGAALEGLERAHESVAEGERVLRSKLGGLEQAILGGDLESMCEARETGRAITRAAIALDPPGTRCRAFKVHGEGWNTEAFSYQGHRFRAFAEFKLEQAFKRTWSEAQAVLRQDLEAALGEHKRDSGDPDGGRLPLLSPKF